MSLSSLTSATTTMSSNTIIPTSNHLMLTIEKLKEHYHIVRGFVSQHRRKIAIGGGIIGTVSLFSLYRRVRPLYDQLRSELKMMEAMAKQMTGETSGKQQILLSRFHHHMNVASMTLRNFSEQTRIDLTKRFDVENIRKQLKKPSTLTSSENSTSRNTADLEQWERFKTSGVTRTIAAMYSIVLLNILIKVQLSIVSRYVLNESNSNTSSASDTSTPNTNGIPLPPLLSEAVNKSYFSLSTHSQTAGFIQLMVIIENAVIEETKDWKLNENTTFESMRTTFDNIRLNIETKCKRKYSIEQMSNIENTTATSTSSFVQFIYPNSSSLEYLLSNNLKLTSETIQMNNNSPIDTNLLNIAQTRLNEMAIETQLIFESQSFEKVLNHTLNVGYDVLTSYLETSFQTTQSLVLATAMVKFIKLFNSILPESRNDNSPLFQALTDDQIVRDFCKVIFMPIEQIAHKKNEIIQQNISNLQTELQGLPQLTAL